MIIKQAGFQSDPSPADGCDHATTTHWLANLGIDYCHFSTFHSTTLVGLLDNHPDLYYLHCHSASLHLQSTAIHWKHFRNPGHHGVSHSRRAPIDGADGSPPRRGIQTAPSVSVHPPQRSQSNHS